MEHVHVSSVKNKTHHHLEKGVDLVQFSFTYFSYLYLRACLISQSCSTLCNPLKGNLPSSPVHGIFQARILRVGCHFLLQQIFLTQGLNLSLVCLLHCKRILYPLSHQGSPDTLLLIGFPSLEVLKMGDLAFAVNLIYDPVSAASALNGASAAEQTPWDSRAIFRVQEMRPVCLVTFRVSNSGFVLEMEERSGQLQRVFEWRVGSRTGRRVLLLRGPNQYKTLVSPVSTIRIRHTIRYKSTAGG